MLGVEVGLEASIGLVVADGPVWAEGPVWEVKAGERVRSVG